MTVTVRFAPSPTGLLHVGNIRIALVNWLFARSRDGVFLLRMDDTDVERSEARFDQGIQDDLAWLGLDHDRFARQTERAGRYDDVIEELKRSGRLYACYETPEELERRRKLQLAQRKPPIYNRAALDLSDADKAALEQEGRQPHWRFRLDREKVVWHDEIRGDVRFDAGSISDPVLVRSDGMPLYTLSSVVDDIDLGITHIIRGEDHVANSAAQVQLIKALGGEVPSFAHIALLTGAEGEGLSKRVGSLSIASLREDGVEAMAINSLLARIGTSDPVEPFADLDQVIAQFDITRFGHGSARFDVAELKHLNARLVHDMPFERVAARLQELVGSADEPFWNAVQPNLERVGDAAFWWQVVYGEIDARIDEPDYIAAAAALLPEGPWDEESWGEWVGRIKQETGRKGKALFLPLRLALTGLDHGPEMKYLLPLIGQERANSRLANNQTQ